MPRGWGITQLNSACIPGMNESVLCKRGIKLVEGAAFDFKKYAGGGVFSMGSNPHLTSTFLQLGYSTNTSWLF